MEPSAAAVTTTWSALALLLLLLAGAAWWVTRLARRRIGQAHAEQLAASQAHHRQELEGLRIQLRAAEARLSEVIDALPAGVAVYDNQDRLLGFNRELSKHHPYRGEGGGIGETYEALMRRALASGDIPEAVGREEEWLAVRMAGRGALVAPQLRHADDGHWVHSFETRTPSGYLVMTRLDITPLVEKGLTLERANEQLLRLSTTDGLTGIANRRLFDQTLQAEWQRCARSQSSLALLVIDIDHFRLYNERYGHLAGDECLRRVTRLLAACVKRSGELVARLGGEELAVLLPGADPAEARRVAVRCLEQVHGAQIPHAGSPVSAWLTVSVGIASMVPTPRAPSVALVEAAEQSVTRAKRTGRARVEVFEDDPVSAPSSLPAAL